MTGLIKRMAKASFRKLGYEIYRRDAPADAKRPQPDLWPWLRATQRIRTIVDIGANRGDFASFLAKYFKPAAFYAFEPLASCVPDLQKKAGSISHFHLFNFALADYTGERRFFENSYGPASSLLSVSEISKLEFPQTAGQGLTEVQVRRLDDVLDPELLEQNILVKIDVQGLEDRVIRGGQRLLSATQCVLIEMSFIQIYDGQPLFEEVHALLIQLGFRFAGIKNQIDSPRSGQPLFAHCLYLRSGRPNE